MTGVGTINGAIVDIDGIGSKSANYTITASDFILLGDASAGAFTFTLPAASGVSKKRYHIKKIDSSGNTITIDGNGAETIDGAITKVLSVQYESITIVSDGTSWWVIQ